MDWVSDGDSACFTVSQDDSSRIVTAGRSACADSDRQTPTAPLGAGDDVEMALARALAQAADARRFDIVGQLARELEARRLARASKVVPLGQGKRGRRRP